MAVENLLYWWLTIWSDFHRLLFTRIHKVTFFCRICSSQVSSVVFRDLYSETMSRVTCVHGLGSSLIWFSVVLLENAHKSLTGKELSSVLIHRHCSLCWHDRKRSFPRVSNTLSFLFFLLLPKMWHSVLFSTILRCYKIYLMPSIFERLNWMKDAKALQNVQLIASNRCIFSNRASS